jgi:hypothetical protein
MESTLPSNNHYLRVSLDSGKREKEETTKYLSLTTFRMMKRIFVSRLGACPLKPVLMRFMISSVILRLEKTVSSGVSILTTEERTDGQLSLPRI